MGGKYPKFPPPGSAPGLLRLLSDNCQVDLNFRLMQLFEKNVYFSSELPELVL